MSKFRDVKGAFARRSILLSLVLMAAAGTACNNESGLVSVSTAQPGSQIPAITQGAAAMQNSYADLVSRVSPAVVTIRSTERSRAPQQFPFMDDPNFREFFGDRVPQEAPRRVQG